MSKGLCQMVKELRQLPGSRRTSQKLRDLHKDNGYSNAADNRSRRPCLSLFRDLFYMPVVAGRIYFSNQTNQQTRQNAQQANARTNTQTRTNQSSGWGSAMRNIGLLAGGMFLGSMLSSLFGWGNMGFMADILGVMFNIILLLVIVSLISHLWRKFRGKKNTSDDDAYRRGYEAAMREERFRHKGMTIDVKPIDDDKDDRRR